MKRFLLLLAILGMATGCSTPQPATASPRPLQRITQLDLTTNEPVHIWNARADTIRQHLTPPVGITFTDEATGQKIHFEGSYKIEAYQPAPERGMGVPTLLP